jgi:hypothetical protein
MAARHWQSRRKKALPKNVWHALALPKRRRFLSLREVARERRENTFHTQVLVIHGALAHSLRIWPFRPANIKSWRA